jgi:protein SCO1/2
LHDNAEILHLFAESYKADSAIITWCFIGSWSNLFLEYTLRSLGQEISAQTNENGPKRLVIAHLLKVFLIDPEGWVREIYTSA